MSGLDIPFGVLVVDVPTRPARRTTPAGRAGRTDHMGPSAWQKRPIAAAKAATWASSSDSLFPSQPRLDGSPSIELLDAKSDTKRVVAEVVVQAPLETVWEVLTNYEALPSYVPNLDTCEILERHRGRVRLRQVGCSQSLLWRISAEAELEIEEVRKTPPFSMKALKFAQWAGSIFAGFA